MTKPSPKQPNLPSHPQLTSSVIMVEPIDFGFNTQTAEDNIFQQRLSLSAKEIQLKAQYAFAQSQAILQKLGIQVITLSKSPSPHAQPDAIFPNNWFSTRSQGQLIIYPMKTLNRQDEVQLEPLVKKLTAFGYQVKEVCDLRQNYCNDEILEGTGAMVFHHPSRQVFAAISDRCNERLLRKFSDSINYKCRLFNASGQNGAPIYHTNVIMSCGQDFAVIADEIIDTKQKARVIDQLHDCVNDLIRITEEQMGRYFCGNLLQLKDQNQQSVIALSDTALKGFNRQQQKLLEKHGSLAVLPIDIIEKVGGGSARCMLAENFLPFSSDSH